MKFVLGMQLILIGLILFFSHFEIVYKDKAKPIKATPQNSYASSNPPVVIDGGIGAASGAKLYVDRVHTYYGHWDISTSTPWKGNLFIEGIE